MKSIAELGQVVSTDVLVLGGGIAGLCAGIKAKESQNDVLIVDKGGIGWAGQVPISGGHVMSVRPEAAKEFFKWAVEDGEFLNNQDWTYTFAQDIYRYLMELDTLGFPFVKAKGEITIQRAQKDYDKVTYAPTRSMLKLKGTAVAKGVQTLDKIYVIDLLRRDGKVVGAIGFGLVDTKTYIFHAKAVIIAVGSCRYQREKQFTVNSGEGPAMAYRAGAQLMNAEFANSYTFGPPIIGRQLSRSPAYLWLENALGEYIMEKHYPEVMAGKKVGQEKQDFLQITDAMAKEVAAGRGPIYLDMSKIAPEEKNFAKGGSIVAPRPPILNGFTLLREKAGIDPEEGKFEIQPFFVGGQGPIRIDLECRTSVDGLWGAGDAASLGSGWTGARASGSHPGWGVAFGTVSGFRAGQSAGGYAATSDRLKLDYGEVEKVKERIFSPLGRGGELDVGDVIYQAHESVVPIKYNFHREGARLKEALGIIEKAKENLARVNVSDHRELCRYHQAESMALAAEFTLKSALMREESRAYHRREDFPNRDDKNWLKWIIIQEVDRLPQLSTEPVPVETYKLKP